MDDNTLNILLVEDDEEDYMITYDLLSEIGEFELEWISDYATALKAIAREEHDVCIVDYHLGKHTGVELLREAIKQGYKAPMILLTGQGGREVDLEATQAGAADFLPKSEIDAPKLERSIRYALARTLKIVGENERRFRCLVQNASDLLTILKVDGTIGYISPAVKQVLGYEPEEMLGKNAFDFVHLDNREGAQSRFLEVRDTLGFASTIEFWMQHKDGTWRCLEARRSNLMDEPTIKGIVINGRDVTERKALEEKLAHQATHDPLTGSANRTLILERLQQVLNRSHREGETFALFFMDLDNFKVINDSLGHQAGDKLLVAVAERCRQALADGGLFARFGGDEFALLIENIAGLEEATQMGDLLLQCFDSPFPTGKGSFFITCSIGLVLGTPLYKDPEELLREADVAMYEAKNRGRACYTVFDPSMDLSTMEHLELESDLRLALRRDEFRVYYQPRVLLENGKSIGAEALIRWDHPERGMVSPSEFIPLAEETGLIVPIGRWVLIEACRQAKEWQEQFPTLSNFMVSVNLSVRQFEDPTLIEDVAEALRETGLDPLCLSLEITESLVQNDTAMAVDTLRSLKDLGIGLEIDDFGTGYSSLAYLRQFPVDTLKIDRSFVSGLGEDIKDAVIVQAVVDLAHSLGMRAIAEGVETSQQLTQLQGLNCDMAQGYYLARPLPSEELPTLLSSLLAFHN